MNRLARIAAALAGVGVMYVEGQHQPSPGIGFAIGMALIMGAVLWGAKLPTYEDDDYDPY